jgi:peroxiredoxin
MKIIFSILIAALFIFSGCNKKENQTKEESKTTQGTENSTSSAKLFGITSAKPSNEKNMLPEIIWNENGKDMKLSDFKGKVMLINFWATWCKPCVGEMPDLSQISVELKDKNFKMIGISTEDQKKIDNFLKTKSVEYSILFGSEEVTKNFAKSVGLENFESIPVTLIVNKEGKIVENLVGSRDKATFLSLINKYLN